MRKFTCICLLLIVAFVVTSSAVASDIPKPVLKSRLITADTVLTGSGGWLIYSFKAYGSAGAGTVGLYDTDALGTTSEARCKAENGTTAQYIVSVADAIGDIPIEMKVGCTVVVVANCYAIIQYVD